MMLHFEWKLNRINIVFEIFSQEHGNYMIQRRLITNECYVIEFRLNTIFVVEWVQYYYTIFILQNFIDYF